jgi:RNA polymerase sigma-70 factor (ECF subfamily)
MLLISIAPDERAFEQLYRLSAEKLRGMAASLLGDEHEAEEVVQEAFITLLVQPPANGSESIDGWLYTVTRNAALTRRVRNERSESRPPARLAREVEEMGVEHDAVTDMADEAFHALVARLPWIQRRALALRFVHDLSTEQVAAALGRSPDAVRQLQSRALRLLRDRLSAGGGRA